MRIQFSEKKKWESYRLYLDGVMVSIEQYVQAETVQIELCPDGKLHKIELQELLSERIACEKAIQLAKAELKVEDIRMQITLARVQIAKGSLDKARTTLRQLRKRAAELSNYDRDQLETLTKAVMR